MPQDDDRSSSLVRSAREFYDVLASKYDAMTRFENRFAKERPAFKNLVERYGLRKALDAGSGSGFHSVVLAQLGVQVTALDLSAEMIRLTERNARNYGVDVTAVQGSFASIPSEWSGRFDGVFVMGNSLPHLLTSDDLRQALEKLLGVLRPGGMLMTQSLNYERILSRRERTLSSRVVAGEIVSREYEYDTDGILFSIVSRAESSPENQSTRETVRLRPLAADELANMLAGLGARPQVFGSILLEEFRPATSTDLVVIAMKQ